MVIVGWFVVIEFVVGESVVGELVVCELVVGELVVGELVVGKLVVGKLVAISDPVETESVVESVIDCVVVNPEVRTGCAAGFVD